ncbi:ferritin-like protein [Parathielavia appendiculata]|uniref:Ferritin n=1 Tax=Parathielavia appendiculata TaxID=2587402 RepID=A0AAN6TWP1_9PEZI|nr:ferritin-like protein [Parathielavia appendiculata]
MSGTEKVLEGIKHLSDTNLDTLVKTTSFKEELEEAIRGHIHIELQSWFFYRKLSNDCCRSNVALHGFGTLWKRCAVECLADANWLESYLAQRGGRSKPTAIEPPTVGWPDSPVDPVQPVHEALKVEKSLLEDLQRLCEKANKCGDGAAEDAIQSHFLRKETRHVKDMGDLLQQCVRVSKQAGHGLYHLDKELRMSGGVVPWGGRNDPDTITEELYKVKV